MKNGCDIFGTGGREPVALSIIRMRGPVMSRSMRVILLIVGAHMGHGAAATADEWRVVFPPRFSQETWLPLRQRLCFGIDDTNFSDAVNAGTNVICGGTNAAGVGFAGGPFILGKHGEIVDIRSGMPVPEKTMSELRARVDRRSARGAKVLGEVIRFYMTPWIQAEHPDWQDINSPGGKPITVAMLKDNRSPRLLELSLRRLVHQVAGRAGQAPGLGWLQHGRVRLLVALFLPLLHGRVSERFRQKCPRFERRQRLGVSAVPEVAARSVYPFRLQVDGRS